MSTVEDAGVVDGGGLRPGDNRLVLRIYDPLSWENPDAHFETLRRKLETYADFVTSGQSREHFPGASAGRPVISIVFAEAPPTSAVELLGEVALRLAAAEIALEATVRDASGRDAVHRFEPD